MNDDLASKIDELSRSMKVMEATLNEMQDGKSKFISKSDFFLHEYDSLKNEIVQRILTRYQIISITLVAFGAVFAIQNPYLALLYPLIALALLLVYISNAHENKKISAYIKDKIENDVSADGKHSINSPGQQAVENDNSPGNAVQKNNTQEAKDMIGWQHAQADDKVVNIRAVGFSAGRVTFAISCFVATIEGVIILIGNSDAKISPDRLIFNIIMIVLSCIISLVTLIIAIIANPLFDYIEETILTKYNGPIYVFVLLSKMLNRNKGN